MKDNLKQSAISVISFAKEKISQYVTNPNEKFIKYGTENKFPNQLLEIYNSVPEHNSAIDFTENNILGEGISITNLDYWDVKKITLDFLIFGGYSIQVIKTRNGSATYKYVDFNKCRFSLDQKQVGYSDNWCVYKPEIKWYPLSDGSNTAGIFIYKNTKSREVYPTPNYISSFLSLDTMSAIMEYHNNNARNGFTPNVVINFNNGVPDEKTQRAIEQGLTDKFTGASGKRFILSFNDNETTKTTVEKLDNDNLDQKFETLQKFIQNQIIVAHKLTSGTLIGIKPENQGFSKTEYEEALDIFKTIVIKTYRKELEYSFKVLTGTEVKFIDAIVQPTTVNNPTQNNPIGGGQA